jgi:hypothetical protein
MEVVDAEAHPPEVDELGQFRATTVDRICEEMTIHPDLLKIDVEGYELNVLRGSERVLREDGPTIFLELHPAELVKFGHTSLELVTYLTGLGYGFRDLRGHAVARDRLVSNSSWAHVVCDRD